MASFVVFLTYGLWHFSLYLGWAAIIHHKLSLVTFSLWWFFGVGGYRSVSSSVFIQQVNPPTLLQRGLSSFIWSTQNGLHPGMPLTSVHRPDTVNLPCWYIHSWYSTRSNVLFVWLTLNGSSLLAAHFLFIFFNYKNFRYFHNPGWLLLQKNWKKVKWMMGWLGWFWLQLKIASWCAALGSDLHKNDESRRSPVGI